MALLVTIGETLAAFAASGDARLRYARDFQMRIAGAESNTAIGVRKLGHSARWISRLGEDEFGHFVLNSVRAEGVDTRYVVMDDQHPTGVMFKQPLPGGGASASYYRAGSAASHLSAADLPPGFLRGAGVLYLTGITPALSESCAGCVREAIRRARQARVQVSFDPNIRLPLWKDADCVPVLRELAEVSDILLLGQEEAVRLYGEQEVDAIFSSVFASPRTRFAALKQGSRGAWVASREERYFIPPVPCHSVNPAGAGDGFNAGFLCGMLDRQPLEHCGRMGAIVGALATETRGDVEGYPSRNELWRMLEGPPNITR